MNLEMLLTCVLGSTQGLLSLHSFPFPVLYLVCFNIPQLFSSWVNPTRTRWSVLSACVREKSFPEPSDVADPGRGPSARARTGVPAAAFKIAFTSLS